MYQGILTWSDQHEGKQRKRKVEWIEVRRANIPVTPFPSAPQRFSAMNAAMQNTITRVYIDAGATSN